MNEKLEIIRKACIAANPEIVELKFGCELKNKHTSPEYDANNIYIETVGKNTRVFRPTFNMIALFPKETFEILGRPIRLSDVLLAVENKVIGSGALNNTMGSVACMWNLRADDLTQQSEETISFLAELLK